MPHTDPSIEELVSQLGEREGPEAFRVVPDATGSDPDGLMSITVDAARRVVAVQVHDVNQLREVDLFEQTLRTAYVMADGERALASLTLSGHADEWVARAEAELADVGASRAVVVPDVSQAASRARRQARADVASPYRPRCRRPPRRPPTTAS